MNRILKLLALATFLVSVNLASAQTAVVVRPPAAPGPTVVAVTPVAAAPVRKAVRRKVRKQNRKAARRTARRTARRVARRS